MTKLNYSGKFFICTQIPKRVDSNVPSTRRQKRVSDRGIQSFMIIAISKLNDNKIQIYWWNKKEPVSEHDLFHVSIKRYLKLYFSHKINFWSIWTFFAEALVIVYVKNRILFNKTMNEEIQWILIVYKINAYSSFD